jgi:hypothetical protein
MTRSRTWPASAASASAGPPRHRTRNTDVLLQLAKASGGNVGSSLPWEKFDDLLYEAGRGLYDAGRGYVVSARAEESLRQILERQGYWAPEFESYDDFWDALGQRGAWWDPTDVPASRKALLQTPTGKFEFYASGLKRLVDEAAARGKTTELPARRRHALAATAGFSPRPAAGSRGGKC